MTIKKPAYCVTLDDQLAKDVPPAERPVLPRPIRAALVDWGSHVYPAIILADGRAVVIDPSEMATIRRAFEVWQPLYYRASRNEIKEPVEASYPL